MPVGFLKGPIRLSMQGPVDRSPGRVQTTTLLANLSTAVVTMTRDGTVEFGNAASQPLLGLTPVPGDDFLSYFVETDRPLIASALDDASTGRSQQIGVSAHPMAAPAIGLDIRLVSDEMSTPCLLVQLFDVTEQRNTARRLGIYASQRVATTELARNAATGADVAQLIDDATRIVKDQLDPEWVAVFEYQVDAGTLVLRSDENWPASADSIEVRASTASPFGLAFVLGTPVVVDDLRNDPRFETDHRLATSLVRSVASVAIHGRGHSHGVLTVMSSSERAFDRVAVDFLASIATLVALGFERREAEDDIRRSQRLEAVGQLASGIAHEINTPIQFIGDNVRFADDVFTSMISLWDELIKLVESSTDELLVAEVTRLAERYDVDFLRNETPVAIAQAIDGVERVASIVQAMKTFGHPDVRQRRHADINEAINTTLTVARNEIKYVADVDVRLGEIPHVFCHPGEMNQVLLSLVVNAAQSIADVVEADGGRGRIWIGTWTAGDSVFIGVGDTGAGIPKEIAPLIFNPFFTTKEVGRGSGQGLAIAKAVVDNHGGQIRFHSDASGTMFCIRLPIDSAPS